MDMVNVTNRIERFSNAGEQAPDPFEDLKTLLGCAYISDLRFPPWNEQALRLTSRIRLINYSLQTLSDLAYYLTNKPETFNDYEQASQYFLGCVLELQPCFEVSTEFA